MNRIPTFFVENLFQNPLIFSNICVTHTHTHTHNIYNLQYIRGYCGGAVCKNYPIFLHLHAKKGRTIWLKAKNMIAQRNTLGWKMCDKLMRPERAIYLFSTICCPFRAKMAPVYSATQRDALGYHRTWLSATYIPTVTSIH